VEIPSGEGAGSDEIIIDEEMLEDQGEKQEPVVPEPRKAMFSSHEMEINQEDDVPNSPGKHSSEIQSEAPTEIDDGPLEVHSPSAAPKANRQNAPSPKSSSRSSDSTSVSGDGSDTDSDFNHGGFTLEDFVFEEDPVNPTKWHDGLMKTISNVREEHAEDEEMGDEEQLDAFEYDFVTHRIDGCPGLKGAGKWFEHQVYSLIYLQGICVTSSFIGQNSTGHSLGPLKAGNRPRV